ncbi:MAG: YlxR family protein [Candidatus Dormibacteraeota bacterium]|nr:YlxR family protein [Candidatus Dormibacteraeota bacterium]
MSGKQGRDPTRTCVACRETGGKRGLLRVARAPQGVVLDQTGRIPGRGAYLHAEQACLDLARRRRSLERSLKAAVPDEVWAELASALAAAGDA